MRVNGELIYLDKSKNLYDFLIARGYDMDIIAVAMNGEIISKTCYQYTTLDDETTLEVVSFVGGG